MCRPTVIPEPQSQRHLPTTPTPATIPISNWRPNGGAISVNGLDRRTSLQMVHQIQDGWKLRAPDLEAVGKPPEEKHHIICIYLLCIHFGLDTRRWLNIYWHCWFIPIWEWTSHCAQCSNQKYSLYLRCLPYLVYTWSVTHDTTPTTMAEWWLQTPCYEMVVVWEVDVMWYSNIGQGGVVPKVLCNGNIQSRAHMHYLSSHSK